MNRPVREIARGEHANNASAILGHLAEWSDLAVIVGYIEYPSCGKLATQSEIDVLRGATDAEEFFDAFVRSHKHQNTPTTHQSMTDLNKRTHEKNQR